MTPTQSIIKFNTDRGLLTFDGLNEHAMLEEELFELLEAVRTNDSYETIDALNDIRVIATGALWKLGQDPDLSLKQTCKEILSRTGAIGPEGKFIKDSIQNNLYVADYELSQR